MLSKRKRVVGGKIHPFVVSMQRIAEKKSQNHTHTHRHNSSMFWQNLLWRCASVWGMTLRKVYDLFLKCMDLIWFERILDTLDLSPRCVFRIVCILFNPLAQKINIKNWNNIPCQLNIANHHSGPKNLLMAIHFYRINNERQQNKWQMNAKTQLKQNSAHRTIFDGYDVQNTDKNTGMDGGERRISIELRQNEILKSVRISALYSTWRMCMCECIGCTDTQNRCDSKWNKIHLIPSLTKGDRITIETRLPQKHALNVLYCAFRSVHVTPFHYHTAYLSFVIRKQSHKTKTKINCNNTHTTWMENIGIIISLRLHHCVHFDLCTVCFANTELRAMFLWRFSF